MTIRKTLSLTTAFALGATGVFAQDVTLTIESWRNDDISIWRNQISHAALAIVAMDARAHVFVEKPLATTIEDCRAVVALARRSGPAQWPGAAGAS